MNTPSVMSLICIAVGSGYLITTDESLDVSKASGQASAAIACGLGMLTGLLLSQAALHPTYPSFLTETSRTTCTPRSTNLRAEMAAALPLHDEQVLQALINKTSEDGNGHAASDHN